MSSALEAARKKSPSQAGQGPTKGISGEGNPPHTEWIIVKNLFRLNPTIGWN